MSIVNFESGISILCDCPYAGKTREVKESPESDQKRKTKLLKELKETNYDLAIARLVLVDTRNKLATLQKIISMELGYVINPYIMTEATWKNRVREESYLKSELLKLVDYLRECDPRYHTDPDVYPTRLSASTEDLLSSAQEKTLKHLYHDYTVYHSDIEKQIGSSLWEFFQLKEKYENKLYHNKVMEQEIAAVKIKISRFQRQFLENKCLIDYITDHHFKMAGCFLHVFPEKISPEENIERKCVMDSEALKFKRLWEDSRLHKRMLLDSVHILRRSLENVNQRIIRAESFCSRNIVVFRMLTRKITEGKKIRKLQPRKGDAFGEFSLIHYRSQKSQLEAAINENNYLKNFLRNSILSKAEDLKRYQQSLQTTSQKFRKILEDIRSAIIEKELQQKEQEAVPEKKKKK